MSSFQHNVLISFIIVSSLMELYSVIINKSLQNTYWEQEVIAIKKAYKNSKDGMRSMNAQAKGASISKAK